MSSSSVSLSVGRRKLSLPINGDMTGSSAYYDVVLPRRFFSQSSHFQPPVIPQIQGNRRGRTTSDVVLEANPAYRPAVVGTATYRSNVSDPAFAQIKYNASRQSCYF